MTRYMNKEAFVSLKFGTDKAAHGNILVHQSRNSELSPFWVFMEVSSYRYNWLNHWPWVIDSSLLCFLEVSRVGWKFQPTNRQVGSPGNQPPSFGDFQVMSIQQKTSLLSSHLRNLKVFRSSVPRTGTKTKYICLIINHSITYTIYVHNIYWVKIHYRNLESLHNSATCDPMLHLIKREGRKKSCRWKFPYHPLFSIPSPQII